MLRIATYGTLGFLLGIVFGPLLTMSDGVWLIAIAGALSGAALGYVLNRMLGTAQHSDFDNVLWMMNRGIGFGGSISLLPEKTRHRMLMSLRSRVTPNKPPVDPAFLEREAPPFAG
jgi:hypothetical protein